ncbi:MAG TPA: hypothetical protein VF311_14650, partial [Terriglobales bacterium]
ISRQLQWDRPMIASRALSVLLLVIGSALAAAQEIKHIDLTGIHQRTELRHPPAPPPVCDGNGRCVSGVAGGGSVGDGAPDGRDPHALGVSLDRVVPSDITLEAFEADFRVLNTGLAAIEVPVSPHLSDLEPPEESKPFTYLSLALVVDLDGTGPQTALGILGIGWVELYGAADHEGTVVTLQPRQWIRVKASVKLHTWPSQSVAATLHGDFWLRTNVFTPRAGGGFTQTTNLYPNRTFFPSIAVHFVPLRSGEQVQAAPKY